ncbi:unnamed protein product [Arabis nemorensis]|uniref:Uncharacterized protein n=1 Tax=Arabis nemorensis TaxID=586526 RepID=A0A565AKI9_9BRAS|nr:unnamed protein product [Arabis nemorensis]
MAGQNARLNVIPTVTMLGVMKARLDGTPDLSNCYAQPLQPMSSCPKPPPAPVM